MTTTEFSNEFDVLYNNIMSNQAPGLDEYEKSVFLTKAQDEILKNYFNPKGNKYQEGFDSNQKRQYDFSNLIRTTSLFNINSIKKDRISNLEKLDKRSIPFVFPQDYFIAINEVISDNAGNYYSVIPLTYDEYHRVMLKPYAYPTKRAAWRILTDKKNCNYYHDYIKDEDGNNTATDYEFLSTWADQKRNLELEIITAISENSDDTFTEEGVIGVNVVIPYEVKKFKGNVQVSATAGWSDNNLTYHIYLFVTLPYNTEDKVLKEFEDDTVVDVIRKAFNKFAEEYDGSYDNDLVKAYQRTDGFMNFSAPSKFRRFQSVPSLAIETKTISLPIAEIIGKFNGDIIYQMRYVKKPKPIILDKLDGGLSIKGLNNITECELPEEVHSEVLQRAVELAKAAYVGDLKSSVELGQRSE